MNNRIYLGLNGEEVSEKLINDFAGIGLIRSEYICRDIEQYVTLKNCQNTLENYLLKVCRCSTGKDVWYRFTDLTTNELNVLAGNDLEIFDKYHFMGIKGVRRHLLNLKSFQNEVDIVVKIQKKFTNFGVIIPYISSIEEFQVVKNTLLDSGYTGKIGIMVEIPITVFLLDNFIELGVDCVIIGMNDLTTLMLSACRESIYHDKLNPHLLEIVKSIQKKCVSNNIKMMVAGYFDSKQINELEKINNLDIIINYANLDKYDCKYTKLKDILFLSNVKKKTKNKRKKYEELLK